MTITYQYRHLGKPNPVHRATEPATAPIGQETPETAAPKHTPTPWRVFKNKDGTKLVGIGGEDGGGILDAGFGVWSWNDPEGIANAELVVKAVNAHHTLWARIRKVEHDNEQAAARIGELETVLQEARLQIEYLHDMFQPTGTGESVLTRIIQTLGSGR